jgi:hypothetical protein
MRTLKSLLIRYKQMGDGPYIFGSVLLWLSHSIGANDWFPLVQALLAVNVQYKLMGKSNLKERSIYKT